MNTTISPSRFNTTPVQTLDDGRNYALGGSLLAIDVCIIAFNILTIMVIARFRTKNATDIFVLALALHDLVKGLVPVPITVYVYFSAWSIPSESIVCNLYGWLAFTCNAGSMLILTLMAIERFFAILKPFHYRGWVSPDKIQVIAFVAVVFTAFHSALPLMQVGRIIPYNNGAYSHFDYSRESKGTIIYSQFIIFFGFGMILVVVIAYSLVFYQIRGLIHRHRRRSRVSGQYSTTQGKELNLKTETMFSYLALALMLLFSFSWLPFLIVVVTSQLGIEIALANLDLFAMRVVVINSMLNPLAYSALCKPYRVGIIYYIRKCFSCFCGCSRPNDDNDDKWDPWRRGSSAVRRRTVESRTIERYTSHSYTDSGIGIGTGEYNRQSIPQKFPSYDTYRAKKENKQKAIAENGTGRTSGVGSAFGESVTRALSDNLFGIVKAHAMCDEKVMCVGKNGTPTRNENVCKSKSPEQKKKEKNNEQVFSPNSQGSIRKKNKYVILPMVSPSKSRTRSTSLQNNKDVKYTGKYIQKQSTASLDYPVNGHNSSYSTRPIDDHGAKKNSSSEPPPNDKTKIDRRYISNEDFLHGQDIKSQQKESLLQHEDAPNSRESPLDSKDSTSINNEKTYRSKSIPETYLIGDKIFETQDNRFEQKSSLDFYIQDSKQYGHTRKSSKTENKEKYDRCKTDSTNKDNLQEDSNVKNSKYTSDHGCLNVRTTVLKDFVQKITDFDSDETETSFCCRNNNRAMIKTSQENCECNEVDENEGTCDRCVRKFYSHSNLQRINSLERGRVESLQSLHQPLQSCNCILLGCREGHLGGSADTNSPFISSRNDLIIPVDYMRSDSPDNEMSSLVIRQKDRKVSETDDRLDTDEWTMYENYMYDT